MNVDRLGRINLEEVKYVEGDHDRRLVPGDVLFNNTNSPALIGKTAYFDRAGDFAFSNHMTRLRPPVGVDSKFLAIQLHTMWMRGIFRRLCSHHVNQASVSSARLLSEVTIALPPLNEQRRIVAAIEEHLSRLDATDGLLRGAGKRVASLRGRILDGVCPPAAARVRIGDLVAEGRKIAYGVLQPGPDVENGVPLVRVGDVRDGRVDAGELKKISRSKAAGYPRTTLEGGEVLLTLVGTIGRTAVVPSALRGANVARAIGVIPLRDDVSPEYVSLTLSSSSATARLGSLAHEVARKTLNLEDVKSFDIGLPPLDEQRRLVARVEEQLSAIDALRAAVERAHRRSASLRRGVLERAFRGELVPQEPSDEPASVLLEHIQAERSATPVPTRGRRATA